MINQFDGLLKFSESFLIDAITLYEIFFESRCRPLTESGCLSGICPVSNSKDDIKRVKFHRENNIKVVMLNLVCLTIISSMCKYCTYSILVKFTSLENIANMLCYHRSIHTKKLGNLSLTCPDSILSRIKLKLEPIFVENERCFLELSCHRILSSGS